VFGAWDRLHEAGRVAPGDPDVVDRLAAELRAGASPSTVLALAPVLREANDLWPAAVAVEPAMERFRGALEDRLGRPVLMTGSGSTFLVLYPDAPQAHDAARRTASWPATGLDIARVAATVSGTPYPPEVVIEEEGA
jgi:4-diphosphocytidyl-2C-methyl-D-erythritol kinase